MSKEPPEINTASPWRCCRLQLMAFALLHLLGSCVHSAPAQPPATTGAQQVVHAPADPQTEETASAG